MDVKRDFIIGDHWFYVKIYCGVRTSDQILTNAIAPLTKKLQEQEIISHWFFIRYNDPDYHLRVRFYLPNTTLLGQLIKDFNIAITPYVDNHFVHKIQADTYQREIERYGNDCIIFSEKLFYHQSETIIQSIQERKDDNLFFLETVRNINTLLNNFNLSLDDKLTFAETNAKSFKNEFIIGKNENTQLYKKYEALHTEFLSLVKANVKSDHVEVLSIIQDIKNSNENTYSLLGSYVHMYVNKAFRSKQRFYELVCYDFLTRHYKTIKYTKK